MQKISSAFIIPEPHFPSQCLCFNERWKRLCCTPPNDKQIRESPFEIFCTALRALFCSWAECGDRVFRDTGFIFPPTPKELFLCCRWKYYISSRAIRTCVHSGLASIPNNTEGSRFTPKDLSHPLPLSVAPCLDRQFNTNLFLEATNFGSRPSLRFNPIRFIKNHSMGFFLNLLQYTSTNPLISSGIWGIRRLGNSTRRSTYSQRTAMDPK